MMSDKFLPAKDELSRHIGNEAAVLYTKLRSLPVDNLGLPFHCLEYFKGSHYKRLFFSIETSAHLLYRAISAKKKPVAEIVLMDYGAGVGTLYTLAKMIGCKKVIYNDHLEDWKKSAQLIADNILVEVDEYVVGDIHATLNELGQKDIRCDIIVSRNVIEHIYKLDDFYSAIAEKQPNALIYSSTTANYNNPASRIKHWLWHRKWEKIFLQQRKSMISKLDPTLSDAEAMKLAVLTRGLAGADINNRVRLYKQSRQFPKPVDTRSNTCDPVNGVWYEHLLTFEEYRQLIPSANFEVRFEPGFWDTHYSDSVVNWIAGLLNRLIQLNKNLGLLIAPFIYVIAEPKDKGNIS